MGRLGPTKREQVVWEMTANLLEHTCALHFWEHGRAMPEDLEIKSGEVQSGKMQLGSRPPKRVVWEKPGATIRGSNTH